jgi:hypothetical protein
MMMRLLASLTPLFQSACANTSAGSLGGFLRVVAGNRHAKSPKAFVECLTEAVCYAA